MKQKNIVPVVLFVVVAFLMGSASSAFAYPKPSAASDAWKLDFTFKKPQAISVINKKGNKVWYWFMPYQVTNNTGADQFLAPDISVANSRGRIIHADNDVPAGLFTKIKNFLKNPLLISPMNTVGRIRQGKDFAVQSVAIWPASKKTVDSMTVFVAGLSGETAVIKDPKTGKKIYLRRTRMIRLKVLGDSNNPQNQHIQVKSSTDIMR